VLQEETGITNVVDPLAGSYYVESLTAELVKEAQKLIDEVEELGGMTAAVESGMPKMRIEEASALRQARIDRGEEVIVGVNKYRAAEETPVEIRDIDNTAVRESQVRRINEVRASRDADACGAALSKLTKAAASGEGNLLELAIDAARARATVGEISDALESEWGRYRAVTRSIAGVYSAAYKDDSEFDMTGNDVESFAETEGRRPRILVCKLGQDGHDRGAKVIATAFADIGFDVDIGPLFQTPEEAVREAIENDVHVIGISSQAAGHKTLVPQVIQGLKDADATEIIVICGGVIPPQDYDELLDAGVAAIYGPGTNILSAAQEVLQKIKERRAS
jgi:methylmalonyl-CoA mutase